MNTQSERTLRLGNQFVTCTIRRRRKQKHIHLRVSIDGNVRVSAPLRCSAERIERAISNKTVWLQTQIEQVRTHREFLDPQKWIMYSGERLSIIRDRALNRTQNVSISISRRECRVINNEDIDSIIPIRAYLFDKAQKILRERTQELADAFGVEINRIFVKNQRTRWGSSSSRRNISLNWRLIMAGDETRDYLIVHELAHQIHMNHSKEFWQLVSDWCPTYQNHDKWLANHSFLLALYR